MAESRRLLQRLRSLFSSVTQRALGGLSGSGGSSGSSDSEPSPRHSRERGNPGSFVRERLKSLDARLSPSKSGARLRGNDEQKRTHGTGDGAKAPVYIAAKRSTAKRRDGQGRGR